MSTGLSADEEAQTGMDSAVLYVRRIIAARVSQLEAQVAGLERMNTEKAAEIRRLRMGNHPAGRALIPPPTLREVTEWHALAEALTERDAEHEGGRPTCRT